MIRIFWFLVLCVASVILAQPSMASDYRNSKSGLFVGIERVYVHVLGAGFHRLPEALQSKQQFAEIVADTLRERFDPEKCAVEFKRVHKNPYGCNNQPVIIQNHLPYFKNRMNDYDPLTRDPSTLNVIMRVNVLRAIETTTPPRDKPLMVLSVWAYRYDLDLPIWLGGGIPTAYEIDNNEPQLVGTVRFAAKRAIHY